MHEHFILNTSRLLVISIAGILILTLASCEAPSGDGKADLASAYTELFNAVKSKDTARIKSSMSKATLSFAEFVSKQQGKSLEDVLKNGMTETTFADSLPKMRDEQAKDGLGHLEVYSGKSKRWEVIPFVLEDGKWKAAFGDAFSGKWKSPGKPLSQSESEEMAPRELFPGRGDQAPPTGLPIDPAIEKEALKQPNPTIGPNATPSPVPNNPTLK